MSNDPDTLIFQSDPERFMDLVTTDYAKTRLDAFSGMVVDGICAGNPK